MVPLAQLFFGSVLMTGALWAIGLAIAIKAIAFAALERSIWWPKAVIAMILANLLSTLVGVCLSLAAAVPTMIVVFLPVVFAVSFLPARRLSLVSPWSLFKGVAASAIAAAVVVLYLGTFFLFGFAQVALDSPAPHPLIYWPLKFMYVYVALIISIGLTTLWEEWIVAFVVRRDPVQASSFIQSVLHANLITLFLAMLYAAAKMLPLRLASGDFLALLQL